MVEEDSYCPQVFGLDCMVELSLGMKQVGILPWEFSVWITWLAQFRKAENLRTSCLPQPCPDSENFPRPGLHG